MKPDSIEAHCNQGTRLESAIARQGRLLAGEWTPPPCRIENLDVTPEDLGENLETAVRDLRSVFLALCDAAVDGRPYVPNVVEDSQEAAEALAKTIIAGFGLSPVAVHDLDALAMQLQNAYWGRIHESEERRRFAAAIRALDGNTKAAQEARYHKGPVEPPARTAQRVASTLSLQTNWLRWYAERNPEMRGTAAKVGQAIATAAGRIEETGGFDLVGPDLRVGVRAWGEAGEAIASAFDSGIETA